MPSQKSICIVTPTFNEKDNIENLVSAVCSQMKNTNYRWHILIIDNCSTDGTIDIIRRIAEENSRVKAIINRANFGHIRSPYYGLLNADGDAVCYLASDFQDPPELLPKMLQKWEAGAELVLCVRNSSQLPWYDTIARTLFYKVLASSSEVPITRHATGFGVYDKSLIDLVKKVRDPYPFFRGLVSQLGYSAQTIEFDQPKRKSGFSKNSLYTLYDIAMLGLTKQSKKPLRIATLLGFALGFGSLVTSIVAICVKLLFWETVQMGIAPMAVAMFFSFGVILIFLGIIGEYILNIHDYVKNQPIVVEKERINF